MVAIVTLLKKLKRKFNKQNPMQGRSKMRTTNKKAASCVESFTDFKASNLSGVNTDKFYIVYSYGWYPLFVFCKESKQWFENMDKYSVSTSRQTSQSRPRTRDPIQRANHAFLKQLIA